jgi:hypothetical protein
MSNASGRTADKSIVYYVVEVAKRIRKGIDILFSGSSSVQRQKAVRQPEQPNHVHVVDICPTIRLEHIPDGTPCFECGEIPTKVYLEYKSATELVVRAKETAGYRCETCEYQYFSHEALAEVFLMAENVMQERGIDETADQFAAARRVEEGILSQRTS